MKKILISILIICFTIGDSFALEPYKKARVYYYPYRCPWGTTVCEETSAQEIMTPFNVNPRFVEETDPKIISKLTPEHYLREGQVDSTDKEYLNYYSNTRFVVLLYRDSKIDTVCLSHSPKFPIRFNCDFAFESEEYYHLVTAYLSTKSKRFRVYYNSHYRNGIFDYIGYDSKCSPPYPYRYK